MNRVTVKLLDQHGINNMKVLVTQIMLPVAIFHALATAGYNKETGILVGIMFVMLVISFGISPLYQPLRSGESFPDRSAGYCRSSLWLQRLHGNAGPGREWG